MKKNGLNILPPVQLYGNGITPGCIFANMISTHLNDKRNDFFVTLTCLVLFTSLISFSADKSTGLAEDVINEVNKFRELKGLTGLTIIEELNEIAQKHSENMARGRVGFGHSGFAKRSAMARERIDSVSSFAENIAYGATSAKELINMWKKSAGHRRNMLGDYEYVGIGIAKDRKGIIYYTLVFVG